MSRDIAVTGFERARQMAGVGGTACALVGILVLLGWALDLSWLKTLGPGLVTMKANAAVGLVLVGGAIWSAARAPVDTGWSWSTLDGKLGKSAAAAALALGALTLAQYAFDIELGVDTVLWTDPEGAPQTSHPGRMAPSAAAALAFLGASLLTVDVDRGRWWTHGLAGVTLLLLLPAMVEYLYGLGQTFNFPSSTRIAVHTIGGLLVAAGSTMLLRMETGPAAALLGLGQHRRVLRWLLAVSLAIPLVLGFTVARLEALGSLRLDAMLAIFATGVAALWAGAVWAFAVFLEREEQQRSKAESAARQSEHRKAAVIDGALDCVITMDHEGRVLDFNPAAEATFGYSREEAEGAVLAELIIPERLRDQHAEGMARFLETGEKRVVGQRIEMSALHADGTEFPVELAISVFQLNGHPVFTAYLRDLTQRVETEQRLVRSLEEKDVLLREVHHRVKNNLQLISSLLNLEARRSDDDGVVDAFNRTVLRIRSIAVLHERLYRHDEFVELALDDYLNEIGRHTVHAIGSGAAGLEIDVDSALKRIGLDHAVATGLIVGELVGNAIKHADDREASPRIRVSARDLGHEHHLIVEDDGPGFPANGPDEGRLGLTLVAALAKQMNGRLLYESSPDLGGARVVVVVPSLLESSDAAQARP